MAVDRSDVLAAHAAARAGSSTPRPSTALPRALQECMSELLGVNDRYHALIRVSQQQARELTTARAEAEERSRALAAAKSEAKQTSLALDAARSEVERLRATLSAAEVRLASRAAASANAESASAELNRQAQDAAQRLAQSQRELVDARRQTAEAERMGEEHYQRGWEEATARLSKSHLGAMRRAEERARECAEQAFEAGRSERGAIEAGALLREQAERRLLLHRAEEGRVERVRLQRRLADSALSTKKAERAQSSLAERLRGVHHERRALTGALLATRAAHQEDLQHFGAMEEALSNTFSQYAALSAAAAAADQRHREATTGRVQPRRG